MKNLVLICVLAVLCIPAIGLADTVAYEAKTSGNAVLDLTFDGLTFTGSTDDGGVAIINDLGTFHLVRPSNSVDKYDGLTFILNVNFSTPASSSPDPMPFSAALTGKITNGVGQSALDIDFGGPQTLTWGNGSTLDFYVNDVNYSGDRTLDDQTLTGGITNAHNATANDTPVHAPEPGSIILFGTIALGTSGILRRKLAKR